MGWQLEITKMAFYVFMPVGAFYAYHQVRQRKKNKNSFI